MNEALGIMLQRNAMVDVKVISRIVGVEIQTEMFQFVLHVTWPSLISS